MNYYTGVPIGGTILFLGGLVGLPIPSNFVPNYLFNVASLDPRKNPYLDKTSLGYLDKGLMCGTNLSTTTTSVGDKNLTISINNLPIVTKTKQWSDMSSVKFSISQVSSMFDIDLNGTTTGLKTSSMINTGSTTAIGTREAAYTDSTTYNWSYDTNDGKAGTSFRMMGTTTSTSVLNRNITDTNKTHTHGAYTAADGDTHTHGSSSPDVKWGARIAGDTFFNTGTQSSLTYKRAKTPSLGAMLITRVW